MRRLPLFLLLIVTAAAIVLAARPRKSSDVVSAADSLKAEYIYLEAVTAREEGRLDDYLMLLRRASQLLPGDPYIDASIAEMTFGLPTTDSLAREEAYARLAKRFDADPTDAYNYSSYVSLADHLGRFDDVVRVWERLDTMLPSRTDPAMNLATALLRRYSVQPDTADYNRALALMNRLEKALGPTMALTAKKINAYALRKDTLSIIRDLETLAASAPGDVNTALFVGRVYDAINRPDSVIAYYERAQEIDPYDGRVNLSKAQFYHSRGDSVAFDREVFKALQSPSMQFEEKLGLISDYVVKMYEDSTQRPRIEQMFETLQEVNPGEADLHALYGAYKATVNEVDDAIEQLSYSLDLNADNREVWFNLVSLYAHKQDMDGIIASARKAMKLYPGDAYMSLQASSALAMQERFGQALAILDSVNIDEVPSPEVASMVYASRGDLLYRLGDRDSAFAEYSRAIEENPDNFMALNNCAYHMAESDSDLGRAELYASIATASDPANSTFIDTYAWVLFKKKDYAKAREQIDSALKIIGIIPGEKPDDSNADEASAEILDHAGDIYFMTGDRKEAVEFWKMALRQLPDNELIKKKVQHKTIFFE